MVSSTDALPMDRGVDRDQHQSSRIQSLDVLRGFALLLAVFISIWYYGGFGRGEQYNLLAKSIGWNYRMVGAIELLVDGKFRAIISMVFGASMLLFLSRNNEKIADFFIRRQIWLIVFGVVNGFLLFAANDILFHLGLLGILLFPFIRMKEKGLLLVTLLFLLINSGKIYWGYFDQKKVYNKYVAIQATEARFKQDSLSRIKQSPADTAKNKKDTLTKQQRDEKAAWEGMEKNLKPNTGRDEEATSNMRKVSYGSVLNFNIGEIEWREAAWTYQFGVWEMGAMILLGMALLRLGIFTSDKFSAGLLFAIGVLGVTIGLLLGWYRLDGQQHFLQSPSKFISSHIFPYHIYFPFERTFIALGYIALILAALRWGVLKFVWRGFAAVGQLALSNYFLQSIFFLFFFSGVGLGNFARLEQYQLYLVALELFVAQLILSVLWLRFFDQGPMEWLIKSLIYWKREKINRKKTATFSDLTESAN